MNLAPFDAVILDMDGVMVDSEARWKDAERPFFHEIVPGWREQDFERTVGLGVVDLYHMLARDHGLQLSLSAFLARCDRLAEEVYSRRVHIARGLKPLLRALARRGKPAALASSSPRGWIRRVLDRFQLHSHFKAVVSVDDVGGEGKPSPAIYRRAIGLLRAEPSRCVTVEDSCYGVLSAKRAGVFCIGLRSGTNDDQDLSLADCHIRGLQELTA